MVYLMRETRVNTRVGVRRGYTYREAERKDSCEEDLGGHGLKFIGKGIKGGGSMVGMKHLFTSQTSLMK